jgi:hypothetical protein
LHYAFCYVLALSIRLKQNVQQHTYHCVFFLVENFPTDLATVEFGFLALAYEWGESSQFQLQKGAGHFRADIKVPLLHEAATLVIDAPVGTQICLNHLIDVRSLY